MEVAPAKPSEAGPPGRRTNPWLQGYRPEHGLYDEVMGVEGQIRPHYRSLVEALGELDLEEMRRRSDTAQRIIHEQGIAYNVYGDPRGMERPWPLDPIPFVISAKEWKALEEGLIQRALLLNRILADCYGPQELVRTGGLPPSLVLAQPDFLRPAHGITRKDGVHLQLHAVDLARSPDGRWWVLNDRTQIPTGSGYALANRLVTSRVFPEAFRGCHVQRLAPFFRAMRESLAEMAPRPTDNPRVVLLTPGPYNETYFEQAWLARYLGYALVEGQDLAVRDGRVWLKTLSGLEPVDVIVRRVDDDWCDPLELRNDSGLGVPGLLEALRAGNVAVANSLGTGLVQTPALMAFLPGLCRRLLGEDLLVPSVATWWCGQPAEMAYVLEHLGELQVKPAYRGAARNLEPTSGAPRSLKDLRRLIQFQPYAYLAQERVELSTAPAWDGARLVPRPVTVRVYLVAHRGSYRVMPGGLTRVSPDPGGRFLSMQSGGSSKDTWVLAEGPVEEASLLTGSVHNVELRRVGNNLPSRLADNFYWLGRYTERADATARLLRSVLIRFSPESSVSTSVLLEPLLNTLTAQGQLTPPEARPEGRLNPEALEAELLAAIFDADRKASLRRIATQLQQLATLVRDRTSNDLWRVLSTVDDRLNLPTRSHVMLAGEAVGVLNQTIIGLASFHGLARENMTRAQGWRFLDMGVRIERCIYLATFLDFALRSTEADNPSVLEAVLEVADSTITYRSRYNLLPSIAAVFDLVVLDDTNPRSLLFQLNQLAKHFDRLPRERQSALPSPAHRLLIECQTRVRLCDPRPLAGCEGHWHESELGVTVQAVLRDLPRLSDAIAVSYFAHSAVSWAGGNR